MNTTKTLLAFAVLASAGAANAAVIDTYTVSVAGTTGGLATGSLTGTGTATFDDTGVLTVDYTALNNQPSAGGTFYTTVHGVYNGTISGSTFTNTSGTLTITSCSAGTIACPAATPVGVVDTLEPTPPLGTNGGGLFATTFNINGGGSNLTTIRSYNNPSPGPGPGLNNKVTYTFSAATPAVPVPAAAWLFGSGLLGLAGTARRRRSA